MDLQQLRDISTSLNKGSMLLADFVKAKATENLYKVSNEGPESMDQRRTDTTTKEKTTEMSQRRNNLAISVQWYCPELINRPMSGQHLVRLERILHFEPAKNDIKYTQASDEAKFEKLLVNIKSAEYDTIKKCLSLIELYNSETVQQIWKLYKQLTKQTSSTCFCGYCKLRQYVDINHCNIFLWRQRIISDRLYQSIALSSPDQSSQDTLWNQLQGELTLYHTPKHVVEALSSAIKNHAVGHLRAELQEWLHSYKPEFRCTCGEFHQQLLRLSEYTGPNVKRWLSDLDSEKRVKERRFSDSNIRELADQGGSDFLKSSSKSVTASEKGSVRSYQSFKSLSEEVILSTPVVRNTKNIYHFQNIQGNLSLGNTTVATEKQQLSDSSDESFDSTKVVTDSGIRNYLPSGNNKESETLRSVTAPKVGKKPYKTTIEVSISPTNAAPPRIPRQ